MLGSVPFNFLPNTNTGLGSLHHSMAWPMKCALNAQGVRGNQRGMKVEHIYVVVVCLCVVLYAHSKETYTISSPRGTSRRPLL